MQYINNARTYKWPKGSILNFYKATGRFPGYPLGTIECSFRFAGSVLEWRRIDLFDVIMSDWPKRHRKIWFGLTCPLYADSYWSNDLLEFAEGRIRYDFDLEGCKVKISRITSIDDVNELPCNEEFRWELAITQPI
jgi:hypothetical protein